MVGGNYDASLKNLEEYLKNNPPAPIQTEEPIATGDSTQNADSATAQ